MAVSTPFQATQSDQAPLRTVLIGQRYEYSMVRKIVKGKMGLYVRCVDTMKRENHMDRGPFIREQANAMIEARLRRDEDLKR